MNREGNAYTFIYATIMVVVVAAILAFASLSLKPRQNKNVEIAKKSDILKSVNIISTADDAEAKYSKYITSTYILNLAGEKVQGDAFSVDMTKQVALKASERKLPVYQCTLDNGETKYILPLRGKGLWGPIWGYVSLNSDKKTIYGATFDHKGETPGLGAEIAKPHFQAEFAGKSILENGKVTFYVLKGGASKGNIHAVDGISGGTITSKGVQAMMNDCLSAYDKFLNE
ncbi:NADH:ubiquinone reductase (Na(+)-transporting) subunit C [Saccharicrinis sp. FJH2]|uniref:NADH:ubiquinone reductase (Na(+)-transporting) subunit C n=1 Tax=Saccharicrinis sp. FJH65 TaxID=3344659 RepID=UPI0035F49278